MTPYEQLRTRCNVLLPDRLKLEFGCEVRNMEGKQGFILWKTGRPEGSVMVLRRNSINSMDFEWTDDVEILGKPLTIEDVLRAMPPMYSMQIFQDGSGHAIYDGEDVDDGYFHFDLTKPLSDPANEPAVLAVLKLLS